MIFLSEKQEVDFFFLMWKLCCISAKMIEIELLGFRYLVLPPQQESFPKIFLKMFLQMKMMMNSAGEGEKKKLSSLGRKTSWRK